MNVDEQNGGVLRYALAVFVVLLFFIFIKTACLALFPVVVEEGNSPITFSTFSQEIHEMYD
jgi:hypothetical protein